MRGAKERGASFIGQQMVSDDEPLGSRPNTRAAAGAFKRRQATACCVLALLGYTAWGTAGCHARTPLHARTHAFACTSAILGRVPCACPAGRCLVMRACAGAQAMLLGGGGGGGGTCRACHGLGCPVELAAWHAHQAAPCTPTHARMRARAHHARTHPCSTPSAPHNCMLCRRRRAEA